MKKIAIIDSGFGGLTVLKKMRELYPNEHFLYIGDNEYCPYGDKTIDALEERVDSILSFLEDHSVSSLILACNTLDALLGKTIKKRLRIPVVGITEAGVLAIKKSGFKRIGVIGTKGTIRSNVYGTFENVTLQKATPGLVPLIESGVWSQRRFEDEMKEMKASSIDALFLGCTHYPMLADKFRAFMTVPIIDPSHALSAFITASKHAMGGYCRFYTSGDPVHFEAVATNYLGSPCSVERFPLNIKV